MGHYYAEMACPKCGACLCACAPDENDPRDREARALTEKYREEQQKLTNAWLAALKNKLVST